jgi:AcrR family transcriptional regulator
VAVVRTPRTTWIDAGLRALGAGGPESVRVETLAQSLGVTKGGFYWHFEDRAELLRELLDAWERAMVDEAIERVEQGGGDARERLRRLFELATSKEVSELMRVDLAVRDWSRRDRAVATRLRHVDNRRMEYMRPLFASFCADEREVEVRCLLVLALFVGSPFIAVDHPAHKRREVIELALAQLLA